LAFNQTDNFFASNDHIVRTSREWDDSAIANYPIPRGVLCVEITPKNHTRLKVGEGDKYYHQLPYIDGDAELSNYYTKQEVDNIITNLNYMSIASTTVYESRNALPKTGNRLGDLRFVKNPNQGLEDPIEYIWNGKKWVLVGGGWTEVDLSGYAKKSEVNPRLDRLEAQAHTHKNKTVLDNTTASYTLEEKSKLTTLHNYDDAPIQRRVSSLEEKAHVHVNKEILDDTTAAFTREEKTKLAELENYSDFVGTDGTGDGTHGLVPAPQSTDANKYLSSDGTWKSVAAGSIEPATADTLGGVKIGSGVNVTQDGTISVTPYDDTAIRQDITALQASAHTHSNKSVLDNTTASYTTEEQTKLAGLQNYSDFVGTDGSTAGTHGLVPAPETTDDGKYLAADGTWKTVPSSYQLPPATTLTLGGVIIGNGVTVAADGTISVTPYSLPTASASTLGGIKVGTGLSIDQNGVLSATGGGGGGEGYSETELISAPIVGSVSSITLLDSMQNYDVLTFEFGITADNLDQQFVRIVPVSDLNDTDNTIFLDGLVYAAGSNWGVGYSIYKTSDTTLHASYFGTSTWSESGTIFSIKGIKYGDGGGGGSKEYLAGEGISITERSEEREVPVDISSEHWVNESPTGGGSRYTISTDRTYLLQRYSLEAGTSFKVKFVPTNPNDIIYYGFDSYPSNSDSSGGITVIGQTGPVDGFEVDQSRTYTMPADRNSLDIYIRINDTIWSSSDVVSAASFTELKLIITESISQGTFIDANVRDGLTIDSSDNTINVTPATNQTIGGVIIGDGITVDENGVISASGGEYIAGDGISIVTGGQIVTDLSSANWGNYADMYDGQRSPTYDSRTFKLRYLHIEPGTQFKIKLTPADPNDTIYWYLYGYENDAATTGGLHFGQSSDPNDWDTDCDYVYTMPAGKSSLDITVRINNTQYGYGDVVTLSKFDEMQYITGTGPTTKTINVTPATTQAIGGVIVGNGLNITQQGVLSLNQLELHCTQNPSS
jgi:hypothetical protein